jgi:hypothetical protein
MKVISSPPRSARPPSTPSSDSPRRRLIELARAVATRPTRQQLLEYLALRRFIRR